MRKHLLVNENEEYLERLGLTKQDTKIYIAILDSGLVSVGEIQHLTEMALSKVLESIRDLVNIGLVKKATGKMPRYYASLPFLRETVSIERETMYTLESMLKSLSLSKEKIEESRKNISMDEFPKITQSLLDTYYNVLLSPTVKEFEEIRDRINKNKQEYTEIIQQKKEVISRGIKQVIDPLESYSKLQSQKFEMKLLVEGNSLMQYLTERKAVRMKILKSTQNKITESIDLLSKTVNLEKENFNKKVNQLLEIFAEIEISHQNMDENTSKVQNITNEIFQVRDEIQTELLAVRDNLVKSANTDILDENTGELKEKGVGEDEINENFAKLANILSRIDFDTQPLIDVFENSKKSSLEIQKKIQNISEEIGEEEKSSEKEFVDSVNDVTSSLSNTLNELNENDETSLNALKEQLNGDINNLTSSIKNEGEDITDKISKFSVNLVSIISDLFGSWLDTLNELNSQPSDVIESLLDRWVDEIKSEVDKFSEVSESVLSKILEPIEKVEDEIFNTISDRIRFVKVIIDNRDKDLQNIMDQSRTFDYTKLSDTWVVVGLPSIYASLTDLLLRAKNKVTVVTPRIDLELVEITRKMKRTIRVTFVADIDKEKDARIIKKVDEEGRIALRAYVEKDLYACIRDSEEIIFGYERPDEEMVGIRTSTPSIVSLIEDRLNETVIRNSKAI